MSWWKDYKQIRNRADELNQSALELLCESLPKGARVAWDHGGHIQHGVVESVVGMNCDHRVRVTNDRTGVTRVISIFHLRPELA
jgi:hypothetical protein